MINLYKTSLALLLCLTACNQQMLKTRVNGEDISKEAEKIREVQHGH